MGTAAAVPPARFVFLFDVDNTLLDNDAIIEELRQFITQKLGVANSARYWEIFERIRTDLGYADYLGTLQQFRREMPHDPQIIAISTFLLSYQFESRLFPGALDVLHAVRTWGTPVILTDGDVVFQPLKIRRSGLYDAVDGNVMVFVHKEQEVGEVLARFPAEHYVFVDDKVRLLTAFKQQLGARVTTVFPRQGHYAFAADVATFPAPDFTAERIGDLTALLPAIVANGAQG
jgi:phosphoglycolate phosphatase-like HAD superfamily hydrolase